MNYRIESLMSARLFVAPQYAFDRVYFLSNLSGHLSLYAMFHGGSVPEPLLPPHIALQNPHLIGGHSFYVFPEMDKILVMIDKDGDENYQPMLIPLDGGFPEPAFNNFFAKYRVHLDVCDRAKGIVYLGAERRDKPWNELYRGDLKTGKLTLIAESEFGFGVADHSRDHNRLMLGTGYSVGDGVFCYWNKGKLSTLYGKLLEDRKRGEEVPLNGLGGAVFSPSGKGAIVTSSVFEDTYSLGYINLRKPGEMMPIKLKGVVHTGAGEMENVISLFDDRYAVTFNIDGCTWVYEGVFNEEKLTMSLKRVLIGLEPFEGGMMEHLDYDKVEDIFVFSFSTATSPTQIYTIEGRKRDMLYRHTEERILGIPEDHLSKGEDASYITHDGLRVSARLYMPAKALGFKGPRPVVYYIHGGPQGQERPDFGWFSMPLIQYLTLRGFAVFVPNVRGSTGYGLSYTKRVDRDWGGQDRLDHVHAMMKVLPKDKRLDVKRAAVVGRSYGGYMTLMQAGLHPKLWKASCDMFGPYDLVTFSERIPETWKPYFKLAIGDIDKPEERRDLVQRSPKTHLHNMKAPMLVIQGRNDPRVVAAESEDLVRALKKKGKSIELLVFENEGHDVLKYENRVTCYNAITDFFAKHLKP
ncbi:MAG: S9 family peptidase [Anaerolineales bacterium]|nr:S9 family peptidase [Anaerolineales bacterium]MCB9113042.1 S9 family peptidase [Anaerolineales bacterium]